MIDPIANAQKVLERLESVGVVRASAGTKREEAISAIADTNEETHNDVRQAVAGFLGWWARIGHNRLGHQGPWDVCEDPLCASLAASAKEMRPPAPAVDKPAILTP